MAKKNDLTRRDFLKITGIGAGAVFASGLHLPFALGETGKHDDFYFLQLSDTHWGFKGPAVNPQADVTLKKAIQTVNSLSVKPDFIVFTGDLTHTTDDPKERRIRMTQFKEIVKGLNVKKVYFLPGEHDASLDEGEAYKEHFGKTHYTFIHKGVHFIALDNVSDPEGAVGDEQITWLKSELLKIKKSAPIVVLTHRPLFDLMPDWDWATKDGKAVTDLLMPYSNVTVFYGHIHQENHFKTGHIAHHSAKSLIFPLPAPGSVPKKAPIPWDPAQPFRGLGFRSIEEEAGKVDEVTEYPVVKA